MDRSPTATAHIGARRISLEDPVYFIAEIGSNYDGDLDRARGLIHLAKEAGADAAKFQHYTAEGLVSDRGFRSLGAAQSHQAQWKQSVFETYRKASLDREWTGVLKEECDRAGLHFMTSPYSMELVDYVDPYVPAFKVGSGDITWPDIIEHMASKGKPILLATGASSLDDIERAMAAATAHGNDVVLLQCNTNYTASSDNYAYVNLNVLREYSRRFPEAVLGLSDHQPGHVAVLGAVALGARVIEKHFTDSNRREGPDHAFAMTPAAWHEMVERTRELELALGDGIKRIEANERETVVVQRRSTRAARALAAGAVLNADDLIFVRPSPPGAIPPYGARAIIGRRLRRPIDAGEHISLEDLV